MFSGIVEEAAIVTALRNDKGNLHITMHCTFADQLKIDQSVSHNGVCLTVVDVNPVEKKYTVTAIAETLIKSNLGLLQTGDKVNLERSMTVDKLLDGHLVQGHVDQTAVCKAIKEADGSWYFTFAYDTEKGNITVEKGSVSVNGVSLTVVNSQPGSFDVAIIPFTYDVTNFHQFKVGTVVNLEFDVIGKYIQKIVNAQLENWMKEFKSKQ
ncbi:MAG: riboflavin synthase [Bacteroidetes bacterium HGW-Bacteroidetes-21]|nr:MAG: riboflavin synthase [Bacteroidetes bacterium HGW-Bacteroidetes-21]